MSEWDPWKRFERERERKMLDPWFRLDYERERMSWDPAYRFEKEMDRLSWDPWYRELKRREWKYDEGALFRDRVVSTLDSKGVGISDASTRYRYGSEKIPEWLEVARIKAYSELYFGPKWLSWIKIGLGLGLSVGALLWWFLFF